MKPSSTATGEIRGRGRPARLSREQIIDAGLELLAEQGIEALTTRALAERIGASRMGLYGWFKNKEVLLDAMAARVLESVVIPESGSWREKFDAWLRGLHSGFRHAAGLHEHLSRQGESARQILSAMAGLVEALVERGVPRPEAARAAQGALWATVGCSICEANMPSPEVYETPESVELLGTHADSVHTLLADLSDGKDDTIFDTVLAQILDGIEATIERARAR